MTSAGPPPMGRQLSDLAARVPDAPALTFQARTVTFGELDRLANQAARTFAVRGVRQGDVVTIGLPNGIECVVAAWAAWKLGASPQPLSPALPARELEAVIELADPALLVGFAPQGGRASVLAGEVVDGSHSDAPLPDAVSPSWKIMTSGGSTGRPKLIMAGSTSALDPEAGRLLQLEPGGVVFAPGPLYHNTGFQTCHTGLLMGNHVILLDRFSPETTLAAVQAHRVDVLVLVPTMMLRILRYLEESRAEVDLSSLRVVWHLAAPCPPWLKRAWIDLIGADVLWELYAGTELISITTVNGAEWLRRPGTVGRPLIGDMAVLGPDGTALPPGEIGDIYMRGAAGAAPTYRYIGAEATTRGEWTTLGDIGWMDADGYLYLSDRRTDLILAGGANIYPAEVEGAILEHPDVLSAVVVGLPDEDLGQRVHAVVQASRPLDEQELRAFVAERLIRYKQPRSYRFVDEHLRDDAGKVRRSAIRDAETQLTPTDLPR
ncbi:MAG: AMP-binding protein [Actinomycetota bacterium]|nr:AMP-binding protein [Actinomycetota bacterium]